VALKIASEKEMHELAEKAHRAGLITYIVADAGRTQIAEGSETVLAVGPASKLDVDEICGHLKLL
jgi:PTH2 family peptidyl-tRNA hydrolase